MFREYFTSLLAVAVILSIVYMGYRNESKIEKIDNNIEEKLQNFFNNKLFTFSNNNENGDFTVIMKDAEENSSPKTIENIIENSAEKTDNLDISDSENNISDELKLSPSQVEEIVKTYIEKNPEIVSNALDKLQQIRMDEIKSSVKQKIQDKKSELENSSSPILGNKDGKSIIVMFYDYNCGYCKQSNDILTNIIKTNKDVKVILKIYPILGSDSEFLAKITTALYMREPKKFNIIHSHLMSDKLISKDDLIQIFKENSIDFKKYESLGNSEEVKNKIKENIDLAKELKINGVPAYIINGELGYLTEDQIKSKLSNINSK